MNRTLQILAIVALITTSILAETPAPKPAPIVSRRLLITKVDAHPLNTEAVYDPPTPKTSTTSGPIEPFQDVPNVSGVYRVYPSGHGTGSLTIKVVQDARKVLFTIDPFQDSGPRWHSRGEHVLNLETSGWRVDDEVCSGEIGTPQKMERAYFGAGYVVPITGRCRVIHNRSLKATFPELTDVSVDIVPGDDPIMPTGFYFDNDWKSTGVFLHIKPIHNPAIYEAYLIKHSRDHAQPFLPAWGDDWRCHGKLNSEFSSFQQKPPEVSGNYRINSVNLQVIQEGRKFRIVVAKHWDRWLPQKSDRTHEDAEQIAAFVASGWTPGAEVCKGEIGEQRNATDSERIAWPIRGQCLFRYNRGLVGKVSQVPDVWIDIAGSRFQYRLDPGIAPDVMHISLDPNWHSDLGSPRATTQEYLAYQSTNENPQPLFYPGWGPGSGASGYRPEAMVPERLWISRGIYNIDDAVQTIEYEPYTAINLRASYKANYASDDHQQAALRIERDGRIVYQHAAEDVNLALDRGYYRDATPNRKYYSRRIPLPNDDQYKFQSGDVLIADLAGLTSRVVLVSREGGRRAADQSLPSQPILRFVHERGGKFEEIKEAALFLDEEFYIEAEYATPQNFQQRDGALELTVNKDDPVSLEGVPTGPSKDTGKTTITFSRVPGSAKVFRAGPFRTRRKN